MRFHTAKLVKYTDSHDHWVSEDEFHGQGCWIEYRMYSRYIRRTARFSLFYVGPEGEARWSHGGPIVKGARGSLIAQATVISAHPRQDEPQVVELEEGDMIMMNGQPMMVIDDRGMEYPSLVTPEEFAVRYPAAMARREAQQARKTAGK